MPYRVRIIGVDRGSLGDKQGRCLAPSEILAYLRVDLPEGQKTVVDRHLDECRLCGGAVEGVAGLAGREGFLRSTDSLLLRLRTRTATAVIDRLGGAPGDPGLRPTRQ